MLQAISDNLPELMYLVITLASVLVTTLLVPALKAWRQNQRLDGTATLAGAVNDYIVQVVDRMAEDELPTIARRVRSGQLATREAVTAELHRLGKVALDETVGFWKDQGVDLIVQYGTYQLENWIRDAANKRNPFPGTSTSKVLIQNEQMRDFLADRN